MGRAVALAACGACCGRRTASRPRRPRRATPGAPGRGPRGRSCHSRPNETGPAAGRSTGGGAGMCAARGPRGPPHAVVGDRIRRKDPRGPRVSPKGEPFGPRSAQGGGTRGGAGTDRRAAAGRSGTNAGCDAAPVRDDARYGHARVVMVDVVALAPPVEVLFFSVVLSRRISVPSRIGPSPAAPGRCRRGRDVVPSRPRRNAREEDRAPPEAAPGDRGLAPRTSAGRVSGTSAPRARGRAHHRARHRARPGGPLVPLGRADRRRTRWGSGRRRLPLPDRTPRPHPLGEPARVMDVR